MSGQSTPAEQKPDARGLRVVVIAARYHREITARLAEGALRFLRDAGADDAKLVWVPGAFELPVACRSVARSSADAIIAVGCVIRGETPHFSIVSRESAAGIMRVMLDTGVPIGNAILTTETMQQALDRCDDSDSNKGWEAAASAIEMARFVDARKVVLRN